MAPAAGKRRFDLLLVWRYDRIARSIQELVNALEEFRSLGIDFIGYRKNANTATAQGKHVARPPTAQQRKPQFAAIFSPGAGCAARSRRTVSALRPCSGSKPS
jgi:DNA invertase Pin-like site-specific DNA recombinase